MEHTGLPCGAAFFVAWESEMKIREFRVRQPFGGPPVRECRVVTIDADEVPDGAQPVPANTNEHDWRPVAAEEA